MNRKQRRHSSQAKRGFWYDIGRILFPDLINQPRAMRARAVVITLGLAAILIGAMVGFFKRANEAGIMTIQARESQR